MRWPRIAAWVVTLALVAAGTWGSLQGLRLLQPVPPVAARGMEVAHGLIVTIRHDDTFAVRLPGRRALLWLRPARGAPISMDHLWRHLHERAPTDVVYQMTRQGLPLAWSAD
jgi:hypothetical protein